MGRSDSKIPTFARNCGAASSAVPCPNSTYGICALLSCHQREKTNTSSSRCQSLSVCSVSQYASNYCTRPNTRANTKPAGVKGSLSTDFMGLWNRTVVWEQALKSTVYCCCSESQWSLLECLWMLNPCLEAESSPHQRIPFPSISETPVPLCL